MLSLIQLLRSELVEIIKRINNGNCDISDVDDMNEVITVLRKTTHRISRCLSMWLASIFMSVVQPLIIMLPLNINFLN